METDVSEANWGFQKVDKILTRQDKWNVLKVMPVSY
jgi:hypothetical protein